MLKFGIAERLGGMDRLKNPQIGQQLMMQFVQAGERALAGQDLLTATKYFTYGVDLSYFSQGTFFRKSVRFLISF